VAAEIGAALYEPPLDEKELLLKWIRRARESQMSHYDMADRLNRRDRWLGVVVIAITTLVGTSAFLSLITSSVSSFQRVGVGMICVTAAVLAALQTFFRYAERAERHRVVGARYGAIRRKLEAIYAGDADARDGQYLRTIRDELDRLAEDAPNVPPASFHRTQASLADAESRKHGR
jgi:hypothetical protein